MARCYKTLSEVEGVAERGLQSYNMLVDSLELDTDNLVDRVIAELNGVIDLLKGRQDDFLNMFGCKDTAEFEARVAAYYNYNNLTIFTGNQLRSIINDFKKANDEDVKRMKQLLDQMFENILTNDTLRKNLEVRAEQIYKTELSASAPEYFMQLISAGLSYVEFGKGILGGKQGIQGSKAVKDSRGILEVSATSITEAFANHLREMEKLYWANLSQADSSLSESLKTARHLLNGVPKVTSVNANSASISLGVTWGQELSELMKKYNNDPNLMRQSGALDDFNNKIKDKIISTLSSVDSRFTSFAKKRIEEMIATDDTLFLVGKSFTQVEGILGEINTMIAISHLLGDKFDSKILSWMGSQKVGSKKRQPSVDVVLGEIAGIRFGIQVKNTMSDLDIPDVAHEIGFANKSIQGIFSQLKVGTNDIEDVYVADTYNVPFKREGDKYVEVGYGTPFVHNDSTAPYFRRYVKTDILIDSIVDSMNMFLTMFAPDFLYMGLGSSFKSKLATLDDKLDNLGGNYVYIVGPKVYFAHDMLSKLVKQLEALKSLDAQEEQMSFKLEAYFGKLEGEKESFNIVSDLNNFDGKGGSKHTIKMKSSWLFT